MSNKQGATAGLFGLGQPQGTSRSKLVEILFQAELERRARLLRLLCKRLGVAYAEHDALKEVLMWAEIGRVLAETQPEFTTRRKRGRPKKTEAATLPIAIQDRVDRLKEEAIRLGFKPTDRKCIEILKKLDDFPSRATMETLLQQVSRGRKLQKNSR